MEKVSVIIPSFNRFKYLLNTIESVKNQTYKNIEIIVVNDCSTEKDYYTLNDSNIVIIHLQQNSRVICGFPCAGYVRNKGIEIATGEYIGFCDDDDIWFPSKIELQLQAMNETGCKMSCTDGLFGNGIYDSNIIYKKYNAEHYYNTLKNIYAPYGLLENGFPRIWTLQFLQIHNCVICSSVLIQKDILSNNMKQLRNGEEDYTCWLKVLEKTSCVYVNDICFYYDGNHGKGQNY